MNRRTLIATGLPLLLFAALASVCFVLVNEPRDAQRFSVGVSVSAALLHMYALVLFVRGFRYFKQELRIAYTLLSVGIAFLGIAIGQLPIINVLNLEFWTDSGAMLIPYLIAVIPTLLGLNRFARSLDLRTRWLSLPIIGTISLALAAAATFLPHTPNTTPESLLDPAIALTVIICIFFISSAWGAVLIRRKAGISYKDSLNWLVVALGSAAVGAFLYMLELLLSGSQGWYYDWSMTIVFFNVTGWLFLRAGYAFSIIGAPDESVRKKQQDATPIDIILHLEGLASNPDAISAITDDLRTLTAQLGPERIITSADQAKMVAIYRKLEDYLIAGEPLRKLTREEIRASVERQVGVGGSARSFWAQVTP